MKKIKDKTNKYEIFSKGLDLTVHTRRDFSSFSLMMNAFGINSLF